jgi:hypothetical protein
MRTLKSIFLAALIVCGGAKAGSIKNIYIDGHSDIHIVNMKGLDSRITRSGRNFNPQLSANGSVAAWLVSRNRIHNGVGEPTSSELSIFINGKIRTIRCEPFIRDYWFRKKGQQVAIDCGGLHFSGREILFDTRTLEVVESFDQAVLPSEKRPAWSHSSEAYEADVGP